MNACVNVLVLIPSKLPKLQMTLLDSRDNFL